jgi:hypothetical protein
VKKAMSTLFEDPHAADESATIQALLSNLSFALPELEKLLDECSDHWGYEVRYGKQLTVAPRLLPSGWAALLYLYRLR